MIKLDNNKRYLQIAFNHDMKAMRTILPLIPKTRASSSKPALPSSKTMAWMAFVPCVAIGTGP